MLFSYKFFIFSQPFQHPNKFYYRKFQNIHLTQPKIKIKTLRERKKEWDRREKEWQSKGQRDRSGKREIRVDGGRRPDRWVCGWSGVGWWLVAARLVTLSKREDKIGVLRTSSVLGGSRTRSVLGGLVLGGDGLDGGTNELLAATMGEISLVLGCDLGDATGGTISLVLGCDETDAWCDLFLLFLSLSLLFSRGGNHLKVK